MRTIIPLLIMLFANAEISQANSFNPETEILEITCVTVLPDTPYEARLQYLGANLFKLLDYAELNNKETNSNQFDPNSGQLSLHSIQYQNQNYFAEFQQQADSNFLLTNLYSEDSLPATEIADIKGIFALASSNSKLERTNQQIDDILELGHINGVTLRTGWELLEPAPDEFDFTRLDEQIERIQLANKKVKIIILGGIVAPQWLYQTFDIPFIEVQDRNNDNEAGKNPAYWHATYLERYRNFVEHFFQHFNGNPAIVGVIIGGPSVKTAEMHMSREWQDCQTPNEPETETCITEQRWLDAWESSIDYFNQYSQLPYGIAIHSTQFGDAATDKVLDYAVNASSENGLFFMQWNGFDTETTFDEYANNTITNRYQTLNKGVQVNAFCTDITNNECFMKQGELIANYEKSLDEAKLDYAEVRMQDLLNPELLNEVITGFERFNPE